jgi:hypothetical protein
MSTATVGTSSRTANRRENILVQKQRYSEFPNMNLVFENIIKESALNKVTTKNKPESSIEANQDTQGCAFVGTNKNGERIYKDISGSFMVEFEFRYLVEAKPEQLIGIESE